MIKHLLFGFWICALTLGSAYGAMIWGLQQSAQTARDEAAKDPVEQLQTRLITVPVIVEGRLKGYVLAQFVFQISAAALKDMTVKPDIFLVDEAFKVIYSGEAIDFRNPDKPNVAALSALIKKNVNTRFGESFVKEVLVKELNFLPQERLRGGAAAHGGRFA